MKKDWEKEKKEASGKKWKKKLNKYITQSCKHWKREKKKG